MIEKQSTNHQTADIDPVEPEVIRISRGDLKKNFKDELAIQQEPNDTDYDQLPTEGQLAAIILIDRMWREKSYLLEAAEVIT